MEGVKEQKWVDQRAAPTLNFKESLGEKLDSHLRQENVGYI